MKIKQFHQFVKIEEGPVNSAIIDFLKGNVFQIENKFIKKFKEKKYSEILELIQSLEQEELIIDIEEKDWIPQLQDNWEEDEGDSFELELEEGINILLIMKIFCHRKIEKIVYYGDIEEDLFDRIKIQIRKKNFNECEKRSKVLGKFKRISEDFYIFNKKYNSCWGKR